MAEEDYSDYPDEQADPLATTAATVILADQMRQEEAALLGQGSQPAPPRPAPVAPPTVMPPAPVDASPALTGWAKNTHDLANAMLDPNQPQPQGVAKNTNDLANAMREFDAQRSNAQGNNWQLSKNDGNWHNRNSGEILLPDEFQQRFGSAIPNKAGVFPQTQAPVMSPSQIVATPVSSQPTVSDQPIDPRQQANALWGRSVDPNNRPIPTPIRQPSMQDWQTAYTRNGQFNAGAMQKSLDTRNKAMAAKALYDYNMDPRPMAEKGPPPSARYVAPKATPKTATQPNPPPTKPPTITLAQKLSVYKMIEKEHHDDNAGKQAYQERQSGNTSIENQAAAIKWKSAEDLLMRMKNSIIAQTQPAPVSAPTATGSSPAVAPAIKPPNNAGPQPVPKNAKPSDMVKGQKYTAKGRVWEWDGEKLVAVQ